jgi:threonine dehydrogenase-like Zn-dependent dehydrogenase
MLPELDVNLIRFSSIFILTGVVLSTSSFTVMFRSVVRVASRGFASQANISSIKRVGVVGAGQMGQGIGVVSAVNAKLNVLMVDISAESLAKSTGFIKSLYEKDIKKGKMTHEDAEAALKRMTTSTDMGAVRKGHTNAAASCC